MRAAWALFVALPACSGGAAVPTKRDSGGPDLRDSAPSADTGDTGDTGDTADTGDCESPTLWYRDADGDGYGDWHQRTRSCVQPTDYLAAAGDCDDDHANAYTGAPERLTDGVDDDCDGQAGVVSIADLETFRVAGSSGEGWQAGGFGLSFGLAGDLDGDGVPDLAIGTNATWYSDTTRNSGAVLVYRGPLAPVVDPLDWTGADAVLVAGSLEWTNLVCAVGDLDGDGLDDLVAAGPYGNTDAGDGVAYLVRGPISGTIDLTTQAQAFRGLWPGHGLGTCAGPGDLDGDGLDDLVLGASGFRGRTSGFGYVYILHGPAGQSSVADADHVLAGTEMYEHLGYSVAALGDVSGDGLPDFGVGNWGQPPPDGVAAFLVLELPHGVAHPRELGVTIDYDKDGDGVAAGDGVANSLVLSRVGDIDDDGYDDVMFGVDQGIQSDLVTSLHGPFGAVPTIELASEWVSLFYTTNHGFESWTSRATGLGDWDGDGRDDLAVSNAIHATQAALDEGVDCDEQTGSCYQGGVFIMAGPIAPGSHALEREADLIEGMYGGAYLGAALEGGTDLDGDGFPDLAVGAPNAGIGDTSGAGVAYVLFGGGWP